MLCRWWQTHCTFEGVVPAGTNKCGRWDLTNAWKNRKPRVWKQPDDQWPATLNTHIQSRTKFMLEILWLLLARGFEWSILPMYVRTCIRTYVFVTLSNVNLHSLFALMCTRRNSCVTCTDDRGRGQGRTAFLDNGGRGGQRSWSSATYMFCGVECWTQLMVGDTEKEKATKSVYKRSQEGKKRTS